MNGFEPLIGEWHGERQMAIEPPMKVFEEVKIEGLGELTVFSTVGEPAELPDSIAIIGGAPAGEPQPMHYFDARGVQAAFLDDPRRLHVDIWRAAGKDCTGPHGPGFNQRFIGEISGDGRTSTGRWECGMGDAGDEWEIEFPIRYFRK